MKKLESVKKILLTSLLFLTAFFEPQNILAIDIDRLQNKTIEIAAEPDYPPYCFIDENGNPKGFSIELFMESAKAVGLDVKIQIGVWSIIKEDLAEGEIDALPLVGRTPEREEFYDFTLPYLTLHGAIFVKEGTHDIKSINDLKNKKIVVMKGDNAEEFVRREYISNHIYTTNTFSEAFNKLAAGEFDAVLTQRVMGLKLLETMGLNSIVALDIQVPKFRQDFCFAVKKGDHELLSILNEGLSIIIANKKFEEIYEKWFGPIYKEQLSSAEIIKIILYTIVPVLFISSIIFIFFLRREVRNRTQSLKFEIEERERIAEELQESELLLRSTEKMAKTGGWEFDTETLTLKWTEGVYSIHEVESNYIPTIKKSLEFYNDDSRIIIENSIKEAVESGKSMDLELSMKTATNSNIWVHVIGNAKQVDGKTVKVFGTIQDITERKLAVEALKENEESLSITFHSIGDGVIATDLNGQVTRMNPAAERLTGWSIKEAKNKTFEKIFNIVDADTRKKSNDPVKTVLTTGKTIALANHTVLISRKGDEYQIADSAAPIKDVKGNIAGSVLVFSDVTEKYKVEYELRKSEERYRGLLTNIEIGVVVHAKDTSVILSNAKAQELLGLSEQQMKGKTVIDPYWQFVTDNNERMDIELYPVNQILKKKKPLKNLLLGIKKSQSEGINWVMVNGFPVLDDNNEIQEIIISFIDLTARKIAEEEVKASREHWKKVISGSPIPFMIHDEKDRVIKISEGWTNYSGYTIEDIPTMGDWTEKAYGRRSGLEKEYIDKLFLIDKTVDNGEWIITAKDGSKRIWHFQTTPLGKSIDGVRTLQSIAVDITDRRKAEHALIESQRLNAIGEMSSAVAHDFNNSLQSIIGNIELALLDNQISDKIRNRLETVRTATSDAATRVQLLQRFGGKKQNKSEHSPIFINSLVNDIIVQSRPIWKDNPEKNGIIFTIETKLEQVRNIEGNQGELRSVLYNLIKNSVEAMPVGGNILIQTGEKEEGVFVFVKDNGKGMSDEIKARIFQPFFTTKGFEVGRGMGLAAAYSIVKEHNGKIYVKESSPEKGTTIEILFPFARSNERTDFIETDLVVDKLGKVLWVDDDPSIRSIAADMLELLGFDNKVVGNGIQALEELDKNQYDLVITDIGMPGMNGWQLSDKIKETYDGKVIIAVLSGWGSEINSEQLMEHGVSFSMTKPFRLNQLKKLLSEAFSNK